MDTGADAGWVVIQQSRGKRDVSEPCRHEDVGRRPALEQTPADIRAIDQRVLRGHRLVIDAADVDVGAAVEQEVSDRDGLRLVKWLLTVAATGMNE